MKRHVVNKITKGLNYNMYRCMQRTADRYELVVTVVTSYHESRRSAPNTQMRYPYNRPEIPKFLCKDSRIALREMRSQGKTAEVVHSISLVHTHTRTHARMARFFIDQNEPQKLGAHNFLGIVLCSSFGLKSGFC